MRFRRTLLVDISRAPTATAVHCASRLLALFTPFTLPSSGRSPGGLVALGSSEELSSGRYHLSSGRYPQPPNLGTHPRFIFHSLRVASHSPSSSSSSSSFLLLSLLTFRLHSHILTHPLCPEDFLQASYFRCKALLRHNLS